MQRGRWLRGDHSGVMNGSIEFMIQGPRKLKGDDVAPAAGGVSDREDEISQ